MKNHTMMWRVLSLVVALFAALTLIAGPVLANGKNRCEDIGLGDEEDIQAALTDALTAVTGDATISNGGFANDSWATIVDRDGIVCAVTFSGSNRNAQWPGSRVISAQKANTAISFSLSAGDAGNAVAFSTALLWTQNQPGGIFFGLAFSNPVDTKRAYKGDPEKYGTDDDPMVEKRIGGVNVFGGGLALYIGQIKVGGLGVSGDTSCADHNVAWRVRDRLALDALPGGVSDNIIFDLDLGVGTTHHAVDISASGFGHPLCGGEPDANIAIFAACPIGPNPDSACVDLL